MPSLTAYGTLLTVLLTASAQQRPTQPTPTPSVPPATGTIVSDDGLGLPWVIDCEDTSCVMQVEAPYTRAGRDEHVALLLVVDRKTRQITASGLFLPSGLDTREPVVARFLDTVPDGNSFTLVEGPEPLAALPVEGCQGDLCMVRLADTWPTQDGSSSVALQKPMLEREHLFFSFVRNGVRETAMLPIYKFRNEIKKL